MCSRTAGPVGQKAALKIILIHARQPRILTRTDLLLWPADRARPRRNWRIW